MCRLMDIAGFMGLWVATIDNLNMCVYSPYANHEIQIIGIMMIACNWFARCQLTVAKIRANNVVRFFVVLKIRLIDEMNSQIAFSRAV